MGGECKKRGVTTTLPKYKDSLVRTTPYTPTSTALKEQNNFLEKIVVSCRTFQIINCIDNLQFVIPDKVAIVKSILTPLNSLGLTTLYDYIIFY